MCNRLKEASVFEQGFHTLMSNYAKETRDYARKILALAKTKEDEELYTLNQGWLGAKQEMDKLSNLFLKMADDITYKVAQPVENHFKETQKIKRKVIISSFSADLLFLGTHPSPFLYDIVRVKKQDAS